MDCVVHYDLLEAGLQDGPFHAALALIPILLLALLCTMLRFPRFLTLLTVALLGGMWAYTAFEAGYGRHRALVAAYEDGAVEIAKGRVRDFTSEGPRGVETFTVDGETFEVHEGRITGGFRMRDVIRAGQTVEIWHKDGAILRVEICG